MIEDIDNQAATLRALTRKAARNRDEGQDAPRPAPRDGSAQRKIPYTMAVTSGKGGVGKTLVSVNLAIDIARRGKKVLLVDADLGLANVDVLLGLTTEYTIQDVLDGRMTLDQVAIPGPEGVMILPAASGVAELSNLTETQKITLMDHMDHWNAEFDVVLVDTGAGISPNVTYFILAVEEILVVVTPDPTSITDAYALIKVMYMNHRVSRFNLLINQVKSKKESLDVYKTIANVADRFLNVGLDYLGYIPHDPLTSQAVRQQKAVVDLYPQCPASRAFAELTDTLARKWREERQMDGRMTFFWRRILNK